jgi:gamma-glutamylcyclotransferase (GGCT)/AIG2-like uncharacterized protein YtfP
MISSPELKMKSALRIFVYGTLKKDFSNHAQYCGGVLRIEPALLRGTLFKLNPDIPVMTIPDEDILAHGTRNVFKDLEVQEKFESILQVNQKDEKKPVIKSDDWGVVRGEVLFFGDAQTRLPLIDDLEEFTSGEPSTYLRVLVTASLLTGRQTSAWAYIAGFDTAKLEKYAGEVWLQDGAGQQ